MVKVGDSIPSVELQEKEPGNNVDLSKELASGKGVIIGVPAAFSPTCSDTHIPAYITSDKLKDAGKVYVISVNDPFVTNAWSKNLSSQFGESSIRFLADPAGKFTRALDLEFDAAAFLGTNRSKRYAAIVKDGKVERLEVEPDPTKATVTAAENVLG